MRTEGIYAISSWQEASYLLLPRLILIVGLLLLPLVMPSLYWKRVVSIINIYVLLALGFDFLAHFVGLVSLGGAFFVGTGGYIAAILNTSFKLPILLTLPIATFARRSHLYNPTFALPSFEGRLFRNCYAHVSLGYRPGH